MRETPVQVILETEETQILFTVTEITYDKELTYSL